MITNKEILKRKENLNNKIKKSLILKKTLNEDPKKFINPLGIKIRKKIRPALNAVIKSKNPYDFYFVKKANVPTDKPVIFTPTHGFVDDIVNSLLAAEESAYILCGNLYSLFMGGNGLSHYALGVVPLDRDKQKSRDTINPKCTYVLDNNGKMFEFAEGVWDISDNALANDLFPGFYKQALMSNAYTMPIITSVQENKCPAIRGEAIDYTVRTKKILRKLILGEDLTMPIEMKQSELKNDALKYFENVDFSNVDTYIDDLVKKIIKYFKNEKLYTTLIKGVESKKYKETAPLKELAKLKKLIDYLVYNNCMHHRNILALGKLELYKEHKKNIKGGTYYTYNNPLDKKENIDILRKFIGNLSELDNLSNMKTNNLINLFPKNIIDNDVFDLIEMIINMSKLYSKNKVIDILNYIININYDYYETENNHRYQTLNNTEKKLHTLLNRVLLKDLRSKWEEELKRLKTQSEVYYEEDEFYYSYQNPYITSIDEAFDFLMPEYLKNKDYIRSNNNIDIPKYLYEQNKFKVRVKVDNDFPKIR